MTIQVFIYLMDKMNMKKSQYKENTYNFTIKELHSALGYSTESQNNNIDNAIKECLQSLKAEGYINYYYDKIDNVKTREKLNAETKDIINAIEENYKNI